MSPVQILQGARLLLVEDDDGMAAVVTRVFDLAGCLVSLATDGRTALQMALTQLPDLVILDRTLPDMDGVEVCLRLREQSDVPIVFLTNRHAVAERVTGLDAGANDYLVKPVAPAELLARARAQLRTRRARQPRRLTCCDLSLVEESREVYRGDRAIELSPREFQLLLSLLRQAGRVLPRERLMREIWGDDFTGSSNVLEAYVRLLRQKLEAGGEGRIVHTVHGIGYVLRPPPGHQGGCSLPGG